jgi:hypothetical protein
MAFPKKEAMMRKLLVQSILVAISVLFVAATGVQAFTVMRGIWPTANTTYAMDASFTNQGVAWVARANEVAQDWNNPHYFQFCIQCCQR